MKYINKKISVLKTLSILEIDADFDISLDASNTAQPPKYICISPPSYLIVLKVNFCSKLYK